MTQYLSTIPRYPPPNLLRAVNRMETIRHRKLENRSLKHIRVREKKQTHKRIRRFSRVSERAGAEQRRNDIYAVSSSYKTDQLRTENGYEYTHLWKKYAKPFLGRAITILVYIRMRICDYFVLFRTFHFVRAFFEKTLMTPTREARPDTVVEVLARPMHSGTRGGRSVFFSAGVDKTISLVSVRAALFCT